MAATAAQNTRLLALALSVVLKMRKVIYSSPFFTNSLNLQIWKRSTIVVDEEIQKLIISHSTSAEIMRLAKSKGTITMRQDGILKVLSGITSMEEVNRVASDLT